MGTQVVPMTMLAAGLQLVLVATGSHNLIISWVVQSQHPNPRNGEAALAAPSHRHSHVLADLQHMLDEEWEVISHQCVTRKLEEEEEVPSYFRRARLFYTLLRVLNF